MARQNVQQAAMPGGFRPFQPPERIGQICNGSNAPQRLRRAPVIFLSPHGRHLAAGQHRHQFGLYRFQPRAQPFDFRPTVFREAQSQPPFPWFGDGSQPRQFLQQFDGFSAHGHSSSSTSRAPVPKVLNTPSRSSG